MRHPRGKRRKYKKIMWVHVPVGTRDKREKQEKSKRGKRGKEMERYKERLIK